MKMHKNPIAQEVDNYTKLAQHELQKRNIAPSLAFFEKAFFIAKKVEDARIERACAFNLGAALIASGQSDRGLKFLNLALPPFNRRDGSSNGDLYQNMATAYQQLNQQEKCCQFLEMAIREYEFESNITNIAQTSLRLALQLEDSEKLDLSAESFCRSAVAFEKLGQIENQLLAQSRQASCLVRSGQKEACILLLNSCKSKADLIIDEVIRCQMLNDVGLSLMFCREFKEAQSAFERNLPLLRKNKDDSQLAVGIQNLAAVCNALEDWTRSAELHKEATRLHAFLSNRSAQGLCFYNQAFALCQLGDFAGAAEAYSHGLQVAKDTADTRFEWQCLEGLGTVKYNCQLTDEASEYFKKAILLCNEDAGSRDRLVSKFTESLTIKGKEKKSLRVKDAIDRLEKRLQNVEESTGTVHLDTQEEKKIGERVEKQNKKPKKTVADFASEKEKVGIIANDSGDVFGIRNPEGNSFGRESSLLTMESHEIPNDQKKGKNKLKNIKRENKGSDFVDAQTQPDGADSINTKNMKSEEMKSGPEVSKISRSTRKDDTSTSNSTDMESDTCESESDGNSDEESSYTSNSESSEDSSEFQIAQRSISESNQQTPKEKSSTQQISPKQQPSSST